MPGVTTRSRSTQPAAVSNGNDLKVKIKEESGKSPVLYNEVAQKKRSKRSRQLKEPTRAVERPRASSGSSQASNEASLHSQSESRLSQASDESSEKAMPSNLQSESRPSQASKNESSEEARVKPEETCVASDDLLSSTVRLAERVSNEAGTLRAEAVKMDREARALRMQVEELRTAVRMQTVKRERMEAFVVHWRKVSKKMPYDTLWGEKNGRMAMYKRPNAPEPVEVTSSDEEGLGISMTIFGER